MFVKKNPFGTLLKQQTLGGDLCCTSSNFACHKPSIHVIVKCNMVETAKSIFNKKSDPFSLMILMHAATPNFENFFQESRKSL